MQNSSWKKVAYSCRISCRRLFSAQIYSLPARVVVCAGRRAVFLLREVFDCEYSEIGNIVGQSETNCRQILRRARQHVSAMRPRFKAPAGKRTDLFERFLEAVETGEMSGLIELLSKDVVLHSDGGGKAVAVPNEVRGADKVARGILGGLQRLVPKTLVRKLVRINGAPGLVNYLQGKPHSVLTLDIQDGRIREIYIVTNPEKLSHIPQLTN